LAVAGLVLSAATVAISVIGSRCVRSPAVPVYVPENVTGRSSGSLADANSATASHFNAAGSQVAEECSQTVVCDDLAADELVGTAQCRGIDCSAVAERQVRRFAAETDRWVRERPVTVTDIQAYCDGLKSVPQSRRMECLRRALNLIPDANAALLAGIVLDKTQDREITEATFRDVVNRSEEVKDPILQEIAKDKSHPCYSDVEWIYEVTGERPTE